MVMAHNVKQVWVHFPTGGKTAQMGMVTVVRAPAGDGDYRSYHASPASTQRLLKVFERWTPTVRVGSIVFSEAARPPRGEKESQS